jgi:hypothetical protein
MITAVCCLVPSFLSGTVRVLVETSRDSKLYVKIGLFCHDKLFCTIVSRIREPHRPFSLGRYYHLPLFGHRPHNTSI